MAHGRRGYPPAEVVSYLNDIDEGAGPLTIIPAKETREVVRKYDYVKGKLPDDQVAACVPRDQWIQLTGSKGTLAVCDTSSCFHFGGRARSGERLFLEFHYTTSAPFYYNKNRNSPPRIGSSGWCSQADDGVTGLKLAKAMQFGCTGLSEPKP